MADVSCFRSVDVLWWRIRGPYGDFGSTSCVYRALGKIIENHGLSLVGDTNIRWREDFSLVDLDQLYKIPPMVI